MFKTTKSSNIEYIKYDEEGKTLEVCFRNGSKYTYENVTKPAYEAFESAKSHGTHFAKHVKNAFKFKKHDKKDDKDAK